MCSIEVTTQEAQTPYNLSVESNQNEESERKSAESKMGKWGVQLLSYLQFLAYTGTTEYVSTLRN